MSNAPTQASDQRHCRVKISSDPVHLLNAHVQHHGDNFHAHHLRKGGAFTPTTDRIVAMPDAPDPLESALRDFAEGSKERASRGLKVLMDYSAPIMHANLRSAVPVKQDREEILSDASLKIWNSRETFEARGMASWLAFVRKISVRCAYDHLRRKGRNILVEIPEMGSIPDGDIPDIQLMLAYVHDRELLYALADRLWFGEPSKDHARGILIVEMLLGRGRSPEEVIARMAKLVPSGTQLERKDLDRFLLDETILRKIAFDRLYWGNNRLAAFLLDLSEKELDQVPVNEGPSAAILRRYRMGIPRKEVVVPGLSPEETEAVLSACESRLPIAPAAKKLLARYKRYELSHTLKRPALWNRLAFQYHAADQLPTGEILSRVEPAAQQIPYTINQGTVNMWTSGKRLLDQLVKFAAQEASA